MIVRHLLRCHGCGETFAARVAAAPTASTRFYLLCPHCALPIRGRATGIEFSSHRIEFFEADALDPSGLADAERVVTIDPYVPARGDSDSSDVIGAFPTMTLMHLLGDRTPEYFAAERVAQEALERRWAAVRRLYLYYLDENWSMFDRTGARLFSDWSARGTVHERTSQASQALRGFALALGGIEGDAAETYLRRFHQKHLAAIRAEPYLAMLRRDRDDGRIVEAQRATFELISLFVDRFESWQMGRLSRWVDGDDPFAGLTLFRDEFSEARDLYQQAFETICSTLRYPVAAQNTVKRLDPDDFGDLHPPVEAVPVRRRPTTMARFETLPNAFRVAYLRQVPGWAAAAGVLDNRMRNTIGHAKAIHDRRSGRIVNPADPRGVGYLDFVAEVFDLFVMLAASIEVLRSVRIASSSDFAWNRSPR